MSEILSQNEIDQLLTAIRAEESDDDIDDFRPAIDNKKVKIYDFKRPDKCSRENLRTISLLHEYFAKDVTNYLASLLKTNCHVHVASVDLLSYDEFIHSIPTPTSLGILKFDKYEFLSFADTGVMIEIDPIIAFSIINFLTGGSSNIKIHHHELTDLESHIMEEIYVRLTGIMRETWGSICDIRPRLTSITTDPSFCQIVSPGEMCILITFEVGVSDYEGMLNILYPCSTLEPIMHLLCAQYWFNYKKEIVQKEKNISDLEIELQVELFQKIEKYEQLKSLKIGDIIWSHVDATCKVKCKNIYLFSGLIIEQEKLGMPKNIKIDEIKNIIEDDYMESKHNVEIKGSHLNDIQIQVTAELGRTKSKIKDILSWGEGTIVELDKFAGEPCDIFANNVLIARGEVVVIDENFGIRIIEIVNGQKNDEMA
jgi:flagellar motor switch protein FliM